MPWRKYFSATVRALGPARVLTVDKRTFLRRGHEDPCRLLTADLLLKEIIDQVNAFADGADQHDDLTVIVLRAVG